MFCGLQQKRNTDKPGDKQGWDKRPKDWVIFRLQRLQADLVTICLHRGGAGEGNRENNSFHKCTAKGQNFRLQVVVREILTKCK